MAHAVPAKSNYNHNKHLITQQHVLKTMMKNYQK